MYRYTGTGNDLPYKSVYVLVLVLNFRSELIQNGTNANC
eukprot:SAG11_NODE_27263_length_334_cov_4.344681_1_plen_38_part_10